MVIENVIKKSFSFNLLLMRITGLYPLKILGKYSKVYMYFNYLLFIAPVPVLSIVFMMRDENATINSVIETTFIAIQIGNLIIKLIPFLQHPENVKLSLTFLESPLFSNYTKDQEKIIQDCIKYSRRLSHFFTICCCIALPLWTIKPFFQPVLKLPIEIWLPYDILSNPKVFVFTFVYVVLGVYVASFGNIAIDPLMSLLMYHATGQVKILKDNLMHIQENVDNNLRNYNNNKAKEKYKLRADFTYKEINRCVIHHNSILTYVKHLEKTYSLAFFAQFFSSIFVICLSCIQLILVKPFSADFFLAIVYLITMLSEIFLYCFFGTLLYEESNSLGTAIYMGKWYEFDIKSRKSLVILMQRSQNPMVIIAGKVFEVSLETFTTIIRRSYSIFAVIKNYY